MKTETGKANSDCILIFKNNAAQVVMIHTEATQGHSTGINAATTGATHDNYTPPIEATAIDPAMTHHTDNITDYPHIEVLQLINPEITVDHSHDHPTNLQGRTHTD